MSASRKLTTLQRRGESLASPQRQLELLTGTSQAIGRSFAQQLSDSDCAPLRRKSLDVVQVNVGKVCNQTCSHCHVDAGPERREAMSRQTAQQVIDFLAASPASTLDITGGAPEMNPNFRWLVQQASGLGKTVIDRCNLTILLAPGFSDLPQFLADHHVHVIASLPCYLEDNCDAQRGDGTFVKSIRAIQALNRLGYAQADSELQLSLVYNPVGTGLPPDQSQLEQAYREQLGGRYSIQFNRLYAITNMPVSRFLDDLNQQGQLEQYMRLLVDHFNPDTIDGLMCRSMVSIDWQGYLFDCDFNQMLELDSRAARQQNARLQNAGQHAARVHVSELSASDLLGQSIRTADHCWGCTAGSGSSCSGTVVALSQQDV